MEWKLAVPDVDFAGAKPESVFVEFSRGRSVRSYLLVTAMPVETGWARIKASGTIEQWEIWPLLAYKWAEAICSAMFQPTSPVDDNKTRAFRRFCWNVSSHSSITCHVDYCNSLLPRLSAVHLRPLQSELNDSAYLIVRKRKYHHVLRDDFYWSTADRLQTLLVYNCLHQLTLHKSPKYARRSLRSAVYSRTIIAGLTVSGTVCHRIEDNVSQPNLLPAEYCYVNYGYYAWAHSSTCVDIMKLTD